MALCGCHQQDDYDTQLPMTQLKIDPNLINRQDDVATMTVPVEGGPSNPIPGKDLFRGVVATASSPYYPGFRGGDADYVDKADAYWMLNWIRKALLEGPLPIEFPDAVQKAKKRLEETEKDANYTLGEEAVQHLEQGLKYWDDVQKLNAAHVRRQMIPWGAGVDSMQRFIDNGGLGFGAKRADSNADSLSRDDDSEEDTPTFAKDQNRALASEALTHPQEEAIALLLDYEKQYHTSPEQMMQREWKAAITKINQLRDNLGLMGRKENSDGDSSEPSPLQTQETNAVGSKDVVPIPKIGEEPTFGKLSSEGAGTQNPAGTSSASDPFASVGVSDTSK